MTTIYGEGCDISIQTSLPESAACCILSLAYEQILASNIPVFDQIMAAIRDRNFDEAYELNSSLLPSNVIEENWKITNEIYLSSLDEYGNLILSDDSRATLLKIAVLPPQENGFGVYDAWGMLDTIYESNIDWEEEKLINPITNEHIIYPNPAGNYFYIDGALNEVLYAVSIYDLTGEMKKYTSQINAFTAIDISDLPSGIYNIRFDDKSGKPHNAKLITLKPNR